MIQRSYLLWALQRYSLSVLDQLWVSPWAIIHCTQRSFYDEVWEQNWSTGIEVQPQKAVTSTSIQQNNSHRFNLVSCEFPNDGFLARFTVLGMCFLPWDSQPVSRVLHGVHIRNPAYQIFTLQFITVTNIQLWSRNERISWLGSPQHEELY